MSDQKSVQWRVRARSTVTGKAGPNNYNPGFRRGCALESAGKDRWTETLWKVCRRLSKYLLSRNARVRRDLKKCIDATRC